MSELIVERDENGSVCKKIFLNMFGLDVRSLAVFRMMVSFTLTYSLLVRVADIDAMFSDKGFYPRAFKLQHDPGSAWAINIHLLSGSATVLTLLFMFHLASLICMFIGYKTLLASIICFIMEVSLQNRNFIVLQGGDCVCRLAHLYAMFLPIGEVWSVDAWLHARGNQKIAATRRSDIIPPYQESIPPYDALKPAIVCGCLSKICIALNRVRKIVLYPYTHSRILHFFKNTSPPASKVFGKDSKHNLVFSLGSMALTVQVAALYLFAGLFKSQHNSWSKDFTGLKLSLHTDEFTTRIGKLFRDGMPAWMQIFLTRASHLIELWCPLLMLLPIGVWNRRLGVIYRSAVVFVFFLFHIGIRVNMDIGHFSLISMSLWCAFIPGDIWERFSSKFCIAADSCEERHAGLSSRFKFSPNYNLKASYLPIWTKVLISAIVYTVIAENAASCYPENKKKGQTYFPIIGPFRILSKAFRLDQKWSMFSRPITEDGWYEAPGVLRGGGTLDLMAFGGPVPRKLRFADPSDYFDPRLLPQPSGGRNRPKWFVSRYASQRWRKFIPYLRQKRFREYRLPYGKYLCRTFNGVGYEADEDDMGQLLTFKLFFYSEPLVCEDMLDEEGKKVGLCKNSTTLMLWNHTCF